VNIQALAKPAVFVALGRLVFASILAWFLAPLFSGEPIIRGSLVIEGSVPSAVNAYILTAQYQRRSDLAAMALLTSTLLSAGTLSLILFFLARLG
jgi:predicted permease